MRNKQNTRPWSWIPTLYFAQGLPYVAVMTIAVILFKRMGLDNTHIALYTSWLYLPWVIKPIWSPFVDLIKTKRWWIVTMQLILGAGFAGIAFSLPTGLWLQLSLAFFWLIAFSSATHDIAADGFYMLALDNHQQAWFVGIRNTFYRIAMISGQGIIVILAGWLETYYAGNIGMAWAYTFGALAVAFGLLGCYHLFILPYPTQDRHAVSINRSNLWKEFLDTFVSFFRKNDIGRILCFLLFFRFAEAQLVKLTTPFLLDSPDVGGLGLSTTEVGMVYGTVGVISLTLGGILGGIAAAAQGLKFWLWPMTFAITLPNICYVYLAFVRPENLFLINAAVAIEQFGYGFGFTAYMLYMIYVARGLFRTAHYAICTAFMAMGMMIPGMFSGMLQEWMGYEGFFLWVMICCIPVFFATAFIRISPEFGRKEK